MQGSQSPGELSLDIVWQRMSQQLGELASTTRSLEAVLKPGQEGNLSPEKIRQLQAFDYLGQTLDDLALLAKELGASKSATGSANLMAVSAKLRLAATKSLIALDPMSVPPVPHGKDNDETLIF